MDRPTGGGNPEAQLQRRLGGWSTTWPALVASFLVAACSASTSTSPGVVESRRHLEGLAPEQWSAAHAAPGEASLDPAWWKQFGDPALDALVEEALVANPDLRVAAARVASAEADARIAGADLYPSASAGFSGSRARQVYVGFPVDDPALPTPLSATATQLGVSLDVSWEIDLWGRLRAGSDAARGELDAARAAYDGARLSLAGQTAKTWFAIVEAREQLALAEEALASYRATGDQVAARYGLGVRSPLDVRLSRTQVAAAEARVTLRRSTLERVARQLELLVGRYPRAELVAAPAGSKPGRDGLMPSLAPIPAGLPAELLARRPDLAEAEQRVFAADRRVAAAKASLLPRLALSGSAGSVSDDLSHLLDGDFGVWSWAANLVQPIFEGGKLRAGVYKAKAGAEASAATYVSTALRAFGEVEGALADEVHLVAFEAALARAAAEADAAQRLAGERYRSGLETYVTLLESQRASLDAHATLLEARRRRLENRIDLVLALGGGFRRGEES